MLLLIDNYDSFTYNVQHYFAMQDINVIVKRNDAITIAEIESLNPNFLVISPGPCSPNEAGISLAAVALFAGRIPILGICLGHQCIVQHFGGKIVRANRVMHGKTSFIKHNAFGLFANCANPLEVMRYHSLIADRDTLPAELKITAAIESSGEIMAVQHQTLPVYGVQFHPESIKTHDGLMIIKNFINQRNIDEQLYLSSFSG